jgi:hypothetical protein
MQWWGYSKEHGWVVLDRSISSNRPGIKGDLLFFRCRDSSTFFAKRASWEAPAYTFARNYLRGLAPEESALAAAELEALESRWPEFELEIGRQQHEAAARAEAARLEAERLQQQRELAERKQGAIAKHRGYLQRLGLSYGGVVEAAPTKSRRAVRCVACGKTIERAIGVQCAQCAELVCGSCGACGCGSKRGPA